jgi:hypothetical protein
VQVGVGDQKTAIPADFAQFICARQIFLQSSLDESHRDNLFRLIMATGNMLEKIRIFTIGRNQGEFCEFLVKVNFDHRSFLIVCLFPNLMI